MINFRALGNYFSTTVMDALTYNFQAIKNEFANVFYTDGSTPLQAPLDANSNRIINVAPAVGLNDALSLSQLNQRIAAIANVNGDTLASSVLASNLQAPTGGSLVGTTTGSLQSVLDGFPALIKNTIGSRQANVLDISGWDPTGTHDMATGYQTLINQAATASVPVVASGGIALLGSTVVIPNGHVFRGMKDGAASPATSSTFFIAHSGKGFYCPNSQGSSGISIHNQSTQRLQPSVVSGTAWMPSANDYDYYFDGVSECDLDRITLQNATKGIVMNGGHNRINNVSGSCFNIGLHVDWSYDSLYCDNFRLWPYFSDTPEVNAYTASNLRSFDLYRVDNAFFSRLFSISHLTGINIGYYAGDGTANKPAGTVNKLHLIGADFDVGATAYHVDANASGHTAHMNNFTAQGRNDGSSTSALMYVEAPGCRIGGWFKGDRAGGNIARLASTASGTHLSCVFEGNTWNTSGQGFPAFESVSGGGHIDVLPGSIFENGGSAPNFAGDVKIW